MNMPYGTGATFGGGPASGTTPVNWETDFPSAEGRALGRSAIYSFTINGGDRPPTVANSLKTAWNAAGNSPSASANGAMVTWGSAGTQVSGMSFTINSQKTDVPQKNGGSVNVGSSGTNVQNT
jgi:hypothetical protein